MEMLHGCQSCGPRVTGNDGIKDSPVLFFDDLCNTGTGIDPLTVLVHTPVEMTDQKNHKIIKIFVFGGFEE
jgi:hypothetical protein